MRSLLLVGWLLVPLLFAAWHYGPGQQHLVLDDAGKSLAEANLLADNQQWSEAVAKYDEALSMLPSECETEGRRIRLARAKVQMQSAQLPEANVDLRSLVEELAADEAVDPKLLAESRTALANSQYYMTWLMRLEGEPRDVWEPEIESARQTFRLLAEKSEVDGDTDAAGSHREDLEAVIRLARLDLSELQALSLPSQCSGCKSGQCKGKKPGKKPGKGKKPGPKPEQKDIRSAGSGQQPETGGH